MTPTEIKNTLTSVNNTLNTISVQGKENMNHLLGCILVLEKLIQEIGVTEKQALEEVKTDADN